MDLADDSELLLQVPLSELVSATQLRDLLAGLTALYAAVSVLETSAREAPSSASRSNDSDQLDQLWIAALVIGTPNDLKLRGKTGTILGVLAVAAAILALPKLQAETEQSRAETEKTSVETVAAELEILEKASRLLSEGKLSREQYDSVLRSLRIGKDSLRRSSGVVREEITTLDPTKFSQQKYLLLLLQRARALGLADPAIDLWIGTLTNDVEALRRALEAGADPKKTLGALIQDLLPKLRDDVQFREYLAQYLIAQNANRWAGGAEA